MSELEVINDLFRGRVSELESSEQEARREAEALKRELEELKKGNRNSGAQRGGGRDEENERESKRQRVEDDTETGEAGFAEFTRGEESQEGQEAEQ